VAELALAARRLRPGLVTTAAFVDVQPPTVTDVVAELAAAGTPAVVVPLLLSGGYHVHVDIAGAVAAHPGAVAARPLGPDPRLAEVLADRLLKTGADPADPATAVVLAAAGSSDPRAVADVEATAALLRPRWAGPVTTGYGSAARPTVPDAVAAARAAGAERVAIAAYLLAPGHFADRLAAAGADTVAAPLLPDDRVAAVLLDRYDAAVPGGVQ
jgi:sirohydrochlorin ferrochelatase